MKTIVKRALDTDVAIASDCERVLTSIESFVAAYRPRAESRRCATRSTSNAG